MSGFSLEKMATKWRKNSWLPRFVVLFLVIIPAMLSAVYMWVFWDPEVYLKKIPVAISTEDVGATSDGKFSNLGNEILDSIVASGDLEYHQVSSNEAIKGLKETRYAFSVVISKEFSVSCW